MDKMTKQDIVELMPILKYMLADVEDKIKDTSTTEQGYIYNCPPETHCTITEIKREIQYLRDNLMNVKRSLDWI